MPHSLTPALPEFESVGSDADMFILAEDLSPISAALGTYHRAGVDAKGTGFSHAKCHGQIGRKNQQAAQA